MNVLVTGGAGFIGSHLVDELVKLGNSVTIADNLSTGKKENINSSCSFKKIDIRSSGMEKLFKKRKFESVFHLAAQMDVRKSVEDPLYDADVNISGGINLLENSRKYGVKNFIFSSSGGVMYGECPETLPDEERYPDPLCPYGNSKLAFEFYLNTYRYLYSMKTSALRFANVYGPRQDAYGEAGVVAIFAGSMLSGKDVRIFGDGNQLRDYVYVRDVIKGCISAIDSPCGVCNIGTGESKSVNELFYLMKNKTGYDKQPVYEPARPGELQASRMNVQKAASVLGWKAQAGFEEGVSKTLEWFEKKGMK